MSKYLERFLSTIPGAQARHIFDLLAQLRDVGGIKTAEEYNEKLKELAAKLQTDEPQPIFKLFQAIVNRPISSELYDVMVKAAQTDLEVAFQEAENVADTLEMHKELYKLTVPGSLTKAIDQLEERISLYEFFNADGEGFVDAVSDRFDQLSSGLSRTERNAEAVYWDPHRGVQTEAEEDCSTDIFSRMLLMPAETTGYLDIAEAIEVFDGETTTQGADVSPLSSSILSLLDGRAHTYWVKSLLLDSILEDGAVVKLRLNLGGKKEFNRLELETAGIPNVVLEDVSYVNDVHTLVTASGVNIDFGTRTNIALTFPDVVSDCVILTLRQKDYIKLDYYCKKDKDLKDVASGKTELDPEEEDSGRINRATEEINTTLSDEFLREIAGTTSGLVATEVTGYLYRLGLDNIRLACVKYLPSGVFCSKSVSVIRPGLLGLKTVEMLPTAPIALPEPVACTMEYYLHKYNYDDVGRLADVEIVPILPYGAGNTTEERLFPVEAWDSSSNNTAVLRFVPDLSDPLTYPIVKRNLIETATLGMDYFVRVGAELLWRDTWPDVLTDLSRYEGQPVRVLIKLADPNPLRVYTISYTVDRGTRKLSDYITLQGNGLLRCDVKRGKVGTIARSDICLAVYMRNNSFDPTLTAKLDEYRLAFSSYDDKKFVES